MLISSTRTRFLNALLSNDVAAASTAVTVALDEGADVTSLYLEVLQTALVEVGERWLRGELSVAQEHAATQVTLGQMHRLRLAASLRPGRGVRAVVAAVEDESHDIGARMVADFLGFDGWEVDFLGANTPTTDLVSFVSAREPALVALSVTRDKGLVHAATAIEALRGLPRPPWILLGGQATQEHAREALSLGADVLVADAWAAVEQARLLVNTAQDEHDLNRMLARMGKAIRELRRGRGWTQQQLGEASDLDRSYVSAVEQGRQNLSLGAILRLAQALHAPLDSILFPDRPALSSARPMPTRHQSS